MQFNMNAGGVLKKPVVKKKIPQKPPIEAAEKVEEKKVEKETVLTAKEMEKPHVDGNVKFEDNHTEPTPQEKLDPALMQSSLTETGQNFEKSDPITKVKFCVGCLRNSISKLGTSQEKFYCQRDPDDDGVVKFILIKPSYTVGMCKWRSEEFVPF